MSTESTAETKSSAEFLAEQTAKTAFDLHGSDKQAATAMIEEICGPSSRGPGEAYSPMHSVSGLAQTLYAIAVIKAE